MSVTRKIDAMHERYGTYPALCRDCDHCITGRYHDRRLSKCELYGMTHSEASDWRKSYVACGMFNQIPEDYDTFIPIIEQIKRAPRKGREPEISGQMSMEIS